MTTPSRERGPARGSSAGAGSFSPAIVLLAALPVLAAVWKQAPCLQRGWGGQLPFWRFCYSDLAVTTETSNAEAGLTAYLTGSVPLDQPPLTGAVMSLLAGPAPGEGALATQRWVIAVWAVLSVVGLAAMAWWVATARSATDRPLGTDPRMVVLAPVAALTVLLSPDLLGVALATSGLWAWTRRQPLLAGALLGAGVMARTYPALLLVVVALFAWRTGRERELPRLVGGALATVAVVALPLLALSPGTLTRAWRTWIDLPAGLGSVWYLPTLAGDPWSAPVLTGVSIVGIGLALVLAGLLVLGAPVTPRLGAVALLVVAVALVSGKSFPVQASLWLVPLVALAGLRWRDHLVWALAEGVHFVTVWLHLGGAGTDRALPPSWYAAALLVRVLAVCWLAVRAWQVATERQPVVEDPAGPANASVDTSADTSGDASVDAPADGGSGDFGRVPVSRYS